MKRRNCLQKASFWLLGLFLLFVVAVHLPVTAQAKTRYKGKDGGLSWTISDKGKLVIKGSGDYVGYYYNNDIYEYTRDTEYHPANIPEWCLDKYRPYVKSAVVQASNVTNMNGFFRGMESLKTVKLSGMDMSHVTDMGYAFAECYVLKSVDAELWDVSQVEDLSYLFFECKKLAKLDLSHWDTSSCSKMYEMFAGCRSLKALDLHSFDTSKVTKMAGMFYENYELAELNLDGWDMSQVYDIQSMFCDCNSLRSLDLSGWDTSSLEDASYAFGNCWALRELNLSGWNLEKVGMTQRMFGECYSLETLHLQEWNLLNNVNMAGMFSGCERLKDIGNLYIRDANMYVAFIDCAALSGVITIYGDPSEYEACFRYAATQDGAELVVNYGGECTYDKLREILTTASANSNVHEGLITGFGAFTCVENLRDGVELIWNAIPLADRIVIEKSSDDGKTYKMLWASEAAGVGGLQESEDNDAGNLLDTEDTDPGSLLDAEDEDAHSFETLNSIDAGSYLDRDVKNGKRYFYRLRAFRGDVEYKNVPSRVVWMAPVELKPETFSWKGDDLYIGSSKNKKASYYVGWVKQGGLYHYLYPYAKPGLCWYEPKLENGKKYTVCVSAMYTDDWYHNDIYGEDYTSAFSEPMTFYYLDAPAVKSVEKLTTKQFRVSWKKNSKATGYELEYADNKKMKDAKTVQVKSRTTLSRKINKTDSSKKYYVRLRSYKVADEKIWYSKWSKIEEF